MTYINHGERGIISSSSGIIRDATMFSSGPTAGPHVSPYSVPASNTGTASGAAANDKAGYTSAGAWAQNAQRPNMTSVENPSVNIDKGDGVVVRYGPSYKMPYNQRSTADKTGVKYTGFLPLEGVHEEDDSCRVG